MRPTLAACLLLAVPLLASACGRRDDLGSRAVTAAPTTSAAVTSLAAVGPVVVAPAPVPDDHGGDAASATPLDLALPYAGAIEVTGDEDWFAVTLRAGVSYDLQTFTQGDTTLELRDAAGAQLAFNDDAAPGVPASRIAAFTPPTAGTYLVVVRGFQAATLRYTLRAFNGATTRLPFLLGATFFDVDASGAPSAGDQLLLTFSEGIRRSSSLASGRAADDFSLPVTGDDFGAGATVTLGPAPAQVTVSLGQAPILAVAGVLDGRRRAPGAPSGIDVAYSNLLGSQATSLPPARWAVDVEAAPAGATPPAPSASAPPAASPPASAPPAATPDDHGDTAATATPITLSLPFGGRIDPALDLDCFQVDLRAGVPYTFLTETAGDTVLELFDPAGQRLGWNDDAGPTTRRSELAHTPTSGGLHSVLVRGTRGSLPEYAVRYVVSGAFLMPRLAAARLVDRDGSGDATAGDEVVVTFSEPVDLVPPAGAAAPLAADELVCLVQGDTFGAAAPIRAGPGADQLTVQLGAGARLRAPNAFDGRRLTAGAPSGLDVDLTTVIVAPRTGARPARWAVDLE